MSFLETVRRARTYLEEQRRVSFRALKREFDLDDEGLEELVDELVDIQSVAVREEKAIAWREEVQGVEGLRGWGLGENSDPAAPLPNAQPLTPNPLSYTPRHLAEKILHNRSAIEGERKQVTVLFADVKGSMELAEELDPEEWHKILDRFFQTLADGVHRFEGTVNQYTGDGIMALFGAPIAHEDHAQRACYAALHLRDALRSYADELRVERGVSFSVRMGLNSGEVIVGKIGDDLRMDYTAQGRTVGLAARMEQLAEPGKILVTEDTAKLAAGYMRLRDLGAARVKGARQALRLFELEGAGEVRTRLDVSRTRGLSGFVGRDEEMKVLVNALERCRQGRGCVVGLVGDAGLGKSRLCYEFARHCRSQGTPLREAQAVAHGKLVPFSPMLALLRARFGIDATDGADMVRNKVAGGLVLLEAKLLSALPLVLDLLGVADPESASAYLEPDARQQQIVDVLPKLLLDTASGSSVVLVEDLHWLDGGSEALLAALVEAVSGSSTLLLVNFRPEYTAPWMASPAYHEIRLQPLGDEITRDLLRHLLGNDPALATLAERIRERALGNPFFLEEIVRDLVEAEELAGDKGAYRLVGPIKEIEVPPTVQSILAARIDRLPDRHKAILQTAAVIGRRFSAALLRRVLEDDLAEEMEHGLAGLVRAEFIDEESLYPSVEYLFIHPLTQEVAYASQLGDQRRRTHATVAGAVEQRSAEGVEERAGLIAQHWEAAGETLASARWYTRAAEWVGTRAAAEGLRHFRKVRDLLASVPEGEERDALLTEALTQIVYLGAYEGIDVEEAQQSFREALHSCRRRDNLVGLVSLHVRYSFFLGGRGDMVECLEHGRAAIRIADESADPVARVIARANIYWFVNAGQLELTLKLADEGLAILHPIDSIPATSGNDPVVILLTFRGWALTWMGRYAEAEATLHQALERATPARSTTFMALAHASLAQIGNLTGRFDVLRIHAKRTLELGVEIGSPRMRNLGLLNWGQSLLRDGLPREALHNLEELRESMTKYNLTREAEAANLCWLARARAECGDLADGEATARLAVQAGVKNGTPFFEAVARLERARLLIDFNPADRQDIAEELSRAESLVDRTGANSIRPFVRLEQSLLAKLNGDHAAFQSLLQESRQLLVEMEATGHLAVVDKLFGS